MEGVILSEKPYFDELSKSKIKLIPDVFIGGNNGGGNAMDGLLGLKLMEMMNPNKEEEKSKEE